MATVANKLVQSQLITNAITGFKQADFIADKILPIVQVDKEKVTIPTYGTEHMKLYNTDRAIKADTQVADTDDWTSTDISLKEHAFSFRIDQREVRNASSQMNLLTQYGKKVAASIALEKEKTAADMLFNASNITQTVTLSGTGQWSAADSDPLGDILTGKSTVRGSTGLAPNTIVFGHTVYDQLSVNPEIRDMIKYKGEVLTPALLATLLGIPKVLVGSAVYSNAGVMTDLWGKHTLIAYTTDAPAQEEPSLGYTWQLKGSQIGSKYTSPSGKIIYVGGEDTYKQAISMAGAGYFIKNSVA